MSTRLQPHIIRLWKGRSCSTPIVDKENVWREMSNLFLLSPCWFWLPPPLIEHACVAVFRFVFIYDSPNYIDTIVMERSWRGNKTHSKHQHLHSGNTRTFKPKTQFNVGNRLSSGLFPKCKIFPDDTKIQADNFPVINSLLTAVGFLISCIYKSQGKTERSSNFYCYRRFTALGTDDT